MVIKKNPIPIERCMIPRVHPNNFQIVGANQGNHIAYMPKPGWVGGNCDNSSKVLPTSVLYTERVEENIYSSFSSAAFTEFGVVQCPLPRPH